MNNDQVVSELRQALRLNRGVECVMVHHSTLESAAARLEAAERDPMRVWRRAVVERMCAAFRDRAGEWPGTHGMEAALDVVLREVLAAL